MWQKENRLSEGWSDACCECVAPLQLDPLSLSRKRGGGFSGPDRKHSQNWHPVDPLMVSQIEIQDMAL